MVAIAKRKILLVDDEDLVRQCSQELLIASDYEVEVAGNGNDAIGKLKTSVYDLVISDVDMPILDGIRFFLCVEKDYPYLRDRFLFTTGDMPQDAESREVLLRVKGRVLKKPFNPKELLANVKALISIPVKECLNREGIDRRKGERHAWNADCSLHIINGHASETFTGQVHDISGNGMKIKYFEKRLLRAGDNICMNVGLLNLQTEGQVMWATGFDGFALAGLWLAEPLPVPQILRASGKC